MFVSCAALVVSLVAAQTGHAAATSTTSTTITSSVARTSTTAIDPARPMAPSAPDVETPPAVAANARDVRPTVRPEDARGWAVAPGIEPEDVLLFTPRVLLTPPRYLLRLVWLPFKGALWLDDEFAIRENIIDVLYNDARTAGVLPTVLFVPGGGGTAGATAFHNDLFGNDEAVSISAKFGGLYSQAYELRLEADRFAGTALWLEQQVRWEVKPKLFFAGIGGDGPDSRFRQDRFLARVRAGTTYGPPDRRYKLGGSIIFNHRRFTPPEGVADGESYEAIYNVDQIPGAREGTELFELTADLIIDHRDRPGFTSRGFYFEGFVGGAPPKGGYRFLHWGAELSVFVDLYKRTRVLEFRAAMEGVEADEGRVPFADLPRLGGPNRLRGYEIDRFRDEKLAVGTVEYHYPIHKNLEGNLFIEAGRVASSYTRLFGGSYTVDPLHFDGTFDNNWKVGYGGGFLMGGADDIAFRLDFSFGDRFMIFFSTDGVRAFSHRTEEL